MQDTYLDDEGNDIIIESHYYKNGGSFKVNIPDELF